MNVGLVGFKGRDERVLLESGFAFSLRQPPPTPVWRDRTFGPRIISYNLEVPELKWKLLNCIYREAALRHHLNKA